jgi:hypothetical protein
MVERSLSAATMTRRGLSRDARQAEVGGLRSERDGRVDEAWQHSRRHADAVLRSAASADEGLRAALRAALETDEE